MRPRRIGLRRNRHQPDDRKAMHQPAALDERRRFQRQDSGLLRFLAGVHLDEQIVPALQPRHLRGQRVRDLVAVDAVDHIKQRDGIGRLVRLQRSDQVEPGSGELLPQRPPFGHRLLNAVLAEITVAGLKERPDNVCGEGLGDDDKPDAARIALRLARSALDPSSDFHEALDGCHCLSVPEGPRLVKHLSAGRRLTPPAFWDDGRRR
jgi:hypothetical protein